MMFQLVKQLTNQDNYNITVTLGRLYKGETYRGQSFEELEENNPVFIVKVSHNA